MIVCPKHNRWIELASGAKRDCPECPKSPPRVLRYVAGICVDKWMWLTPEQTHAYDKGRMAIK